MIKIIGDLRINQPSMLRKIPYYKLLLVVLIRICRQTNKEGEKMKAINIKSVEL